jgi:hypothetical protein
MAEEQKEVTHAEQWDSTYEIMQNALSEMHESDPPEVEAKEEVVTDERTESIEPERSATDTNTPTYQEAEAAQEEPSSGEVSAEASETTEEAVQPSEERKARTDLDAEDAEVYGNLKPKAQERFEHWINRAKELEATNDGLEQSKQLHQYIHESTTNPEQLQWAAELFRNLNSGNYQAAQGALQSLDQFADKIGEALGVNKSDNEASSYTDFEDLNAAVDNLEISEDWANRLASERVGEHSQHQAQERFSQANQQQYQYQQQMSTLKDQAYNDIEQWEQNISSSDADYAAKRDIMLDIGRELAASNISPDNWLPSLQQQYNILSRGMSAATTNGNASKKSGPLAPSRTSGGAVPPKDLDTAEVTPEFLKAHLEAMRE